MAAAAALALLSGILLATATWRAKATAPVEVERLRFLATLSSLAYDLNPVEIDHFAKSHALGVADVHTEASTDTHYVAMSDAGGTLYIAFRGTELSRDNLESDLDTKLTAFHGGARVSAGFLWAWNSVRDRVLELIEHIQPRQLHFTGHSLGAALAALAAVDVQVTSAHQREFAVTTFASPRVGDAAFVTLFRRVVNTSYRVEGLYDPIPRFPLEWQGYRHVPTQVLLDTGRCVVGGVPPSNHPWDVKYHHIAEYLHLLGTVTQCT